jgi:hypothetical protein
MIGTGLFPMYRLYRVEVWPEIVAADARFSLNRQHEFARHFPGAQPTIDDRLALSDQTTESGL